MLRYFELDKFFTEPTSATRAPGNLAFGNPTFGNRTPDRVTIYGYICYFLISLALLLPYVKSSYCHFDELMLLAEAKRVFLGELQHRDFFSFYGGGQFYLVAAVWWLLGEVSYPAIKLLTFVTITFGGVLLLLTTRRFTSRFWLALLPSIIFLNYQAQIFPFSNHHWFGSVTSIVFCYFAVRFLFSLQLRDLYFCGAATGLSLLFIMSEGLVNLIASLMIIAAAVLLLKGKLTSYSPARMLAVYFAGLATLMVPALLIYLSQGLLKPYLYNTFLWPFANYSRKGNINDLPWAVDLYYWRYGSGRLLHLSYFLTSCALLLLLLIPVTVFIINAGLLSAPISLSDFYRISPAGQLAERFNQLRVGEPTLWHRYQFFIIFALVVMAGGLYAVPVRSQPEFVKLLWGSVRAYLLAALLLDRGLCWLANQAGLRRALLLFIAFLFITLFTTAGYQSVKIVAGDESQLVTPETTRMTDQTVVDLINRETSAQDYFFAYNYRLTFFYFVLQARPATPFTLFAPGYLSPAQQQQLVADLARKRPKFMAFSSEEDLFWITNLQSGLIDWFNQNYQLRFRADGLLLYQRKDAPNQ